MGSRCSRSAFTLLEMLVVLSILSLLLGLGVGVYLRIAANLAPSLTVGRVKTVLRLARNTAVREASPSVVYLDARAQFIRANGSRTVAYWHCEDGEGAFGRNITPVKGSFVPGGRVGGALKLEPGGFADCGTGPELDVQEGISIDAYVWPEAAGAQTFVRKGDAYYLVMNGEGFLVGRVMLAGGVREDIVALTGAIPTDRFSRVGLIYNRAVLALHVDGRQVAIKPETRRLDPDPAAPLLIGDRAGALVGLLDEIRIREILTAEEVKLPEEVRLLGNDFAIVFDSTGKLDPAWHAGEERIRLRMQSGDTREIAVSALGTVE